jgi:hypothetical protein
VTLTAPNIAGAAGLATLLYTLATTDLGYVYATAFTRQITINKKFSRSESVGKDDSPVVVTYFMVSDTKGRVYEVTNNFWRIAFKSTELWNKIEEGQNYKVKGYGWRFGFLHWYPNIVGVTKCNAEWKCKGRI